MTPQQALVWLFTAASGAAVFCFVLLVQWYWRRERMERERLRKARLELAELSILFQSIREVIAENKRVAAGFSRDVESRVEIVKDILRQSVARTRELYERQRKLAERIVTLEHRLQELEQAAGRSSPAPHFRNDDPPRSKGMMAPEKPTDGNWSTPAPRLIRPSDEASGKGLSSSVEDLAGTGLVSGKPVEPWRPTDLPGTVDPGHGIPQTAPPGAPMERETAGSAVSRETESSPGREAASGGQEPEPADRNDAPEQVENGPNGWSSVRQAFQELLDLGPDPDENVSDALPVGGGTVQAAGEPPADPDFRDGDPRALETLKRRVAAYRAAGMSEEAIARELGIGRGEVRLMLSLFRLPRGS